jgi:DNA repair protein RadC
MDTNVLSDRELVALIVGAKTATKLYEGRLTPLMLGEGDRMPHPKLSAAIELSRRLMREELQRGPPLCSSRATKDYLVAQFLGQEYESFISIFLDNQHRVIRIEEMFRGTIDGSMVHPREVVRAALKCNAAACIFAHNHPSGVAEPSQADQTITRRLKNALALVDIRTLDHLVVGADSMVSLAERGVL